MLSTTGGLLHLQNALDEAIRVEVMFHVGACTVRAPAKMLFPMWATQGCLQPFEFLDLPEPERARLQTELDAMIAGRTPPADPAAAEPEPAPMAEAASEEAVSQEESVSEEEGARHQSPSEDSPSGEAVQPVPDKIPVQSDLD